MADTRNDQRGKQPLALLLEKESHIFEETLKEPEFFEPEQSELFWAVQKLSPKYREVTYLYYYEEYSIKEIAKLLHISETAIQTRLMRAREKLREQLKEAWK